LTLEDRSRGQYLQEGRPREHPAARSSVRRTEVDWHRRHGVADSADPNRVEVARGGEV